jgi:PAS domain S-box-containing protein
MPDTRLRPKPDSSSLDASRWEAARNQSLSPPLARIEEIWRLLMGGTGDFALVLVDRQGIVCGWNEAATRMFVYPPAGILGEPLDRLFTPEERGSARPAEDLRRALDEGRTSRERWLQRSDGSRFWGGTNVAILRGPSQDFLGYAFVVRDLSERTSAEDRLRRAADRTEAQVQSRTRDLEIRNRELEGFSASVAHDLRAPLRSIHRYAELLLHGDARERLDPDDLVWLEKILESSERMGELIDDLLDYGRLGTAEVEPRTVDLGLLVGQAVRELADDVKERRASIEVRPGLPRAAGDPALVHQILANLLSNALKFVPVGVEPRIAVGADRRNGRVRLWVEDNGIGIPAEQRDRIFMPFVRLHGAAEYPGTGIGLAIVKRAAERMGGTAGIEPVPGAGSRFWVDLPAGTPGGGP